ncbi:MAG: tetratricopeptide repeat protein [Sandaracinaceae bacterium]|nr:tetratricopeptide repeat protein [Sandaracinaceae bacterium]
MTSRHPSDRRSRTSAVPSWLAAALVFVSVPWASSALAQVDSASDARALQLYEAGSAAYTEGRYEDSVDAWSEAYRLSPRPLLLYNLANAYERLGRYADAAQMLEGYLPSSQPNERATLQTRITNLRTRAESEPPRQRSGGGTGGLLVPGIAVAAGGVALVAAGVVFGVLALDARDGVQGGADAPCRESTDGALYCTGGAEGQIADAELYALLADIGMIGGGVVAAAGLVLLIVGAAGSGGGGSSGGSSTEQVSLQPDVRVGPNGASFGLMGRF